MSNQPQWTTISYLETASPVSPATKRDREETTTSTLEIPTLSQVGATNISPLGGGEWPLAAAAAKPTRLGVVPLQLPPEPEPTPVRATTAVLTTLQSQAAELPLFFRSPSPHLGTWLDAIQPASPVATTSVSELTAFPGLGDVFPPADTAAAHATYFDATTFTTVEGGDVIVTVFPTTGEDATLSTAVTVTEGPGGVLILSADATALSTFFIHTGADGDVAGKKCQGGTTTATVTVDRTGSIAVHRNPGTTQTMVTEGGGHVTLLADAKVEDIRGGTRITMTASLLCQERECGRKRQFFVTGESSITTVTTIKTGGGRPDYGGCLESPAGTSSVATSSHPRTAPYLI